jgi:2-methylcitrate dehydratase PrpD
LSDGLGSHWESRNSSFKPYPAAHVLHPYVDAVLRARREHDIARSAVERIDCAVAAFIVPIVCEPVEEKVAPATQAHGRVSLQYTIAEALSLGMLGRTAYESYRDPGILDLARRVHYYVDPEYPGPGQFTGAVHITLRDGRKISVTQEHNLGSPENPMSEAELRAKFDDNTAAVLDPLRRERLAQAIAEVEALDDVSVISRSTFAGAESTSHV